MTQQLAPRLEHIASLFLSVEDRLSVDDQSNLLEGLFSVFNAAESTPELPFLDRIFRHDDVQSCKRVPLMQFHSAESAYFWN